MPILCTCTKEEKLCEKKLNIQREISEKHESADHWYLIEHINFFLIQQLFKLCWTKYESEEQWNQNMMTSRIIFKSLFQIMF